MGAGTAALEAAHARLRAAQDRDGGLAVAQRRAQLLALRSAIRGGAEDIARAIDRDFGGRSRHETLIADVATVLAAIDHALPRLHRWARPEPVFVGWRFAPARARIVKEPRGVVGILAPWNYPVQLALLPLVGALAAGCRAILKPSERAPATTALLGRLLGDALDPEVVAVVDGGPEVAAALAALPLDAILFTGSTATGRKVLQAAAANLTPCILELGGKSPALVDAGADLAAAADAIVAGKLFNAGQTCVAPDYALVPRASRDAFVAACRSAAARLYPQPCGPDTTAILGEAARRRLLALQEGHATVPLIPGAFPAPRLAPVLVLDPDPASPLMREEIFGPILPVLTYETLDEAIRTIAGGSPPLVIYWFGREGAALDEVLRRTRSGGVAVGETLLQAAIEPLPFGGVGASGMGAYHGRAGFEAFTHRRSVFVQSRFAGTRALRPPYGRMADRLLRLFLR